MGSRVKEDQRIERAIRSLLKLPENRRCINCNSLGPQYVCATFGTFVCTNCSGIHREFTHRVKSISMAKFTTEEVNALRAGGNEQAKKIYFKEWDRQRDAYPDGSNIFKLRDFIKSVYVEKRYCCQSNDKINGHKLAITEDSRESKNTTADIFRSRSSHSPDISERSTSGSSSTFGRKGNETLKFYFDEKKNKHIGHNNSRSRGLPKSPIRFEIVDDRFRDDGSVKKYDGHGLPTRDSRRFTKSLDFSNNNDTPNSPIVRHTSEVFGDNAPRLLGKVVKKKDKCEDTMHKQITTSSSKKTLEEKMGNPRSLIDDVSVPEPSNLKSSSGQTSNELSTSLKKTQDPAPKSLEDLLFGLSVPSVETSNSEIWSQSDISSTNNYPAANVGPQMMSETPDRVTSFVTSPTIVDNVGSSAPTFLGAVDNEDIKVYTKEMVAPSVAASNQVASTSPKGLPDASIEHSTLDISCSALVEYAGVGSESHQNDTKSSVRTELPEDLFTGGFSFASPQVHSWQIGQHHGMGYGMQYYQYPMAMGAITYTAKPTNPFDLICDDTSPNQVPQFPSMAYMDSSSPVAESVGLIASQSPFYSSALSPSSPSPTLNFYPGAYIGQQPQVNMPPNLRRQGMDGVGTEGNNYNVADTFHQANTGYLSTNPNAYISRGNPFG